MGVEWLTLLTFVPAALALNLTPGADMLFCLGVGARSGARAAWAASAGIAAGALVHATVAGLGLGAVLAAMPYAFDIIRWIGVGYLLYLAIQALRAGGEGVRSGLVTSVGRAFRDGLLVNLTNPKVILFALAFVPQFVNPTTPILPQFLIFGSILGLGGFVINGVVGVLAGDAGRRFAQGSRLLDWLSASIFTALALRLAFLERT